MFLVNTETIRGPNQDSVSNHANKQDSTNEKYIKPTDGVFKASLSLKI